jgi:cytidylate kinase
MHRRDESDAPQTQRAPDAVLIDTTQLSVEQVVEKVGALVAERRVTSSGREL